MASRDTAPQTEQTVPVHAAVVQWFRNPRTRFSVFQWATAILVAGYLGGLLLLVSASGVSIVVALLFVVALSPFGMMLVGSAGYLRKFLLVVILLEIPIGIDYNVGWRPYAASFAANAGFTISLSTIALAILYAWWLVDILSKRVPSPPRSLLKMTLPSIAYLFFIFLSLVVVRDVTFASFGINRQVQAFLLYVYALNYTKTRQDVVFIFLVLMISLLGTSLFIVGVSVVQGSYSGAFGRSGGRLVSPNVAGAYLALALLYTFSLLTVPVGRWSKRLAALLIFVGAFALLATGSRGGWGGLVIAATLFCLLVLRRGWLSPMIPISYIALALCLFVIFYEPIMTRLLSPTIEARGPLNVLAMRMIRDHFLLGVGINNYVFYLRDYVTSEFGGVWISTVHNKYLLVWAETGIGGLATFIWFLLATLAQGWQIWKRRDRVLSPLALAGTLAIVGWMFHMAVEIFIGRPQIEMLWFTAGVIAAMYNMDRQEDGLEPPVTQGDSLPSSYHKQSQYHDR